MANCLGDAMPWMFGLGWFWVGKKKSFFNIKDLIIMCLKSVPSVVLQVLISKDLVFDLPKFHSPCHIVSKLVNQ